VKGEIWDGVKSAEQNLHTIAWVQCHCHTFRTSACVQLVVPQLHHVHTRATGTNRLVTNLSLLDEFSVHASESYLHRSSCQVS